MQAKLTIHASNQVPRRRLLRAGEKLVIGRGASGVGLRLDDRLSSRRHVQLELIEGVMWATDLGSRNGTFVGAERLERGVATRIPHGKIVRIGRHTLTIETSDAPSRLSEISKLLDAPPLPVQKFEVLGEIGIGAVGRVWAARQLEPDRVVAIKELRTDIQLDDEDRLRFLREADLYRRVKSDHVVELYDVHFEGSRPFLIMELVGGPTAKDRVQSGAMPIAEALRIGEHVALGLDAIAAAGVVHRDVKPQNILLTPDGVAKLTDLGIAKDVEGTSVTSRSMGMGTLPYAAPEQVQGASRVSTATDLYGLAATLYHMISGRPPFLFLTRRKDILEVIEQILEVDPTPLRETRPECPKEVDALVLQLLAKEPEARPGPASDVAKELRRLREEHYAGWEPSVEESEEELEALD